nr:hypothetical protein [Tanacetum cinerariifolium]
MLSRTLLCLAITSASTPLLADTVWLKNGDKLTGTIKVFDGGKLLLNTKYAGDIPLDWKEVKTLESDQHLLGNVDAALDFQRADKDTDDYNIAFKTSATHGRWRHNAEGEYNRETQDEDTTIDNWKAEYSIDRFITDKWFWD